MVGIKVKVVPNQAFDAFVRMFQQDVLAERSEMVMRYITHGAASAMLEDVKSKIPSGPTYNTYKNALRLVQVPTKEPVFGIMADSPQKESSDNARDIIYFKLKNNGRRTPPEVKILLEYQPWTVDTLPIKPPEKYVEAQKRRVSEREVELVRKAINDKRRDWTEALTKLRIRIEPMAPADTDAVPDVAYTALRLEYGLGGSRAVAHWRPALASVQQRVAQLFLDDKVGKALMDPEDEDWKKWRSLSEEHVPATVIESFGQFQDKIR